MVFSCNICIYRVHRSEVYLPVYEWLPFLNSSVIWVWHRRISRNDWTKWLSLFRRHFICILSEQYLSILINIPIFFLSNVGPIDNTSSLVQIMASRRSDDKSLPQTMLTQFTYVYTRTPRVKLISDMAIEISQCRFRSLMPPLLFFSFRWSREDEPIEAISTLFVSYLLSLDQFRRGQAHSSR